MPSTGFNRVRNRSRVVMAIGGTRKPYLEDEQVHFYNPLNMSERTYDYVRKKNSEEDRFQTALNQNSIDNGSDFEVFRTTRTRNNPRYNTKLYFNSEGTTPPNAPGPVMEIQSGRQAIGTTWDPSPPPAVSLPDLGHDPLGLKSYWGPAFFDKANPTKPKASLAQFALELLLGLPTFPLFAFQKLGTFRSLGSEYLNVEFGWLPFVSDIRKMVRALDSVDKQLAQLARDSGRPVRRRLNLHHSVREVVSYHDPGWWLTTHGYIPQKPGHREVYLTRRERVWGSGRFKYHFEYKPLELTAQTMRIILGAELNPRTLYELLPWSWLLDWFTNTGYNVSNWVSNKGDSFAAEYAYVMGSIDILNRTTYVGNLGTTNLKGQTGLTTVRSSELYVQSYRGRYSATPYGFGLNPAAFTAKQWAILVALGITKHSPV